MSQTTCEFGRILFNSCACKNESSCGPQSKKARPNMESIPIKNHRFIEKARVEIPEVRHQSGGRITSVVSFKECIYPRSTNKNRRQLNTLLIRNDKKEQLNTALSLSKGIAQRVGPPGNKRYFVKQSFRKAKRELGEHMFMIMLARLSLNKEKILFYNMKRYG